MIGSTERTTMTTEQAVKIISDSLERNICVMQAAFIEWHHGEGADAAMQWIVSALDGPGLIPEPDEPHGTDAQAYFNANAPSFDFPTLATP